MLSVGATRRHCVVVYVSMSTSSNRNEDLAAILVSISEADVYDRVETWGK